MKKDSPYLKYILDAISMIEGYMKSIEREEFLKDAMTQDAVVRNLEVIGEGTKRLSRETRQLYPEIPWAEVAGTRHMLIHAYFDVDLNEVWITIHRDIPRLKSTIEKAIAELSASEGR